MRPVSDIAGDQSPLPGRRLVLLGTIIALATIAIAEWSRHVAQANRPELMLLYVGADDCAPCRAWRKGDGADFRGSAAFARISYREVRSPHLDDVLNDENWPADIRDYRSRIRRSDGVPLWLVIADGRVVEQQFGATAWRERILPAVKSYLR
jgi:hypothetical protein